jgi:hypothetical protein
MIMIGVAIVLVHHILAEQMVGDGVTGFAILGHFNPLRRRNARICRMRAPPALSHGAFALVKAQSIRERSLAGAAAARQHAVNFRLTLH